MTAIETGQINAVLNEGSAVRLNSCVAQAGQEETHIYFNPSENAKSIVLNDHYVEGVGHTLDVTMTLRNVYPGRRVAVGVAVYEVDKQDEEFSRGFRAVTIPMHTHSECSDVAMPCMRFVLPDDICTNEKCSHDVRRHFVIRVNSHYVDTFEMPNPDGSAPIATSGENS